MKNISLILNIVLLIAVAVLYYLHFSSGKPASAGSSSSEGFVAGDIAIAYINSDTVLKYYDYAKVNRDKLEAKTKKYDDDFNTRAQGLRNEFAAYQRNVNNMTLGQVKATEEDLAKKQQNLQMYQQRLSQEVMMEEARISKELYDRLTTFLNKYSKEKGIQVVFKYDVSSDVLQASEALDISQDVIKGLNEEFKNEKPATDTSAVKK